MNRFRKKPIIIEAVKGERVMAAIQENDWRWLPSWLNKAYHEGDILNIDNINGTMAIRTLEGDMSANPTDWIIRGVAGELYPCRADIFAATYEAVD